MDAWNLALTLELMFALTLCLTFTENRETCYIHVKLELLTVMFKIRYNPEAGLLIRKLEFSQVWNLIF